MPRYKLTNTGKVTLWKEIILGNLRGRDTQQMSAEEFLERYPHAEMSILKEAIAQLLAEGKVRAV